MLDILRASSRRRNIPKSTRQAIWANYISHPGVLYLTVTTCVTRVGILLELMGTKYVGRVGRLQVMGTVWIFISDKAAPACLRLFALVPKIMLALGSTI